MSVSQIKQTKIWYWPDGRPDQIISQNIDLGCTGPLSTTQVALWSIPILGRGPHPENGLIQGFKFSRVIYYSFLGGFRFLSSGIQPRLIDFAKGKRRSLIYPRYTLTSVALATFGNITSAAFRTDFSAFSSLGLGKMASDLEKKQQLCRWICFSHVFFNL